MGALFKKIQNLNVIYKKIIIFSVIILLGLAISFFVIKDFKRSLEHASNINFVKNGAGISGLSKKIKEDVKSTGFKEGQLEEELKEIEKGLKEYASSSSSTETNK